MSFISVFEELSSLYESEELGTGVAEVAEEVTTKDETEEKPLTEAIEDDEVAEAAIEEPEEVKEADEVEELASEEVRQLVLECANCGAVVIRAESDVKVDEESDLANMEEPCQYCEEAAGYKIAGIVAPYEVEEAAEDEDAAFTDDEVVEESLLDVNLPIDVDVQANGNDVSVGTLG